MEIRQVRLSGKRRQCRRSTSAVEVRTTRITEWRNSSTALFSPPALSRTSAACFPVCSASSETSAVRFCHFVGSRRRLGHVPCDLRRRRPLFLHRRSDRASDGVDLTDGLLDPRHGSDRDASGIPHLSDVRGDLLGGPRGLRRERLHLGGNHGKAFAGIACPRRLDRGIQRQQIGLGGDLADHVGDRADACDLLVQRLDGRAGLASGGDRAADDFGGLRNLAADLGDRGAELLGGACDGCALANACAEAVAALWADCRSGWRTRASPRRWQSSRRCGRRPLQCGGRLILDPVRHADKRGVLLDLGSLTLLRLLRPEDGFPRPCGL